MALTGGNQVSDFKYYNVTIKGFDICRPVFAKSEQDALRELLEQIGKVYDVEIVSATPGVINFTAEVDKDKTAEHNKAVAVRAEIKNKKLSKNIGVDNQDEL
jgi:hypothetical protein